MNWLKNKIQNEKGSITLYVLITMMLFLSVSLVTYMQSKSKNSTQLQQLGEIQKEYQSNDIDEIYKETEAENKGKINVTFYTPDGKVYNINEWTNQDLTMKITYPYDVKEEDQYYYLDGEKIKYTDNEIIKENCVISTKYDGKTQDIHITKIDKKPATVTFDKNGEQYIVGENEKEATVTTKITADDVEGSGVQKVEYQITTSTTEPAEDSDQWKEISNGQAIAEQKPGGAYYVYAKVTDVAGNIKIYKSNQFKISYKITYDANEGSGAPAEQIKEHGIALTLSSTEPTRTGYTFLGWSTSKTATSATYLPGASYTLNESVTLYAVWSTDSYTVTYDYKTNGGTSASKTSATVNYGSAIDLTPTATKDGYTFVGWNTNKDATTGLSSLTMETSNVTLYAIWKDTTLPTVKMTPNGGTFTLSTLNNCKISVKLSANDIGSGLKTLQYAWSTSSSSEPSEWNSFTNGETISKSDITTPGTYYLWTKVLDKVGNRATEIKISNAFVVKSNTDTTCKITITANTKDWTNQNVIGTVTYGSLLTSNKKAGFGTTLEEAKKAISESTSSKVIATTNGYIYAEATDRAGNKVSNYLEITNIDKTAPTTGIIDEGVGLYSDPTFASGVNGTTVYNSSQNGTVTNTRVAISGAPSPTSNYGLKITTNGTASPGLGGFYFGTKCSAGKVLITKIVAKIPQGYTIEGGSNHIGNNSKQGWLTSKEGTGDWQEYVFKVECGLTGTIDTTNFFYLGGNAATASQPVTWYVSYAQVFDAGNNLYADPTFGSGVNGTTVYNNSQNVTVTNTRVAISDAPSPTSNYGLKITTNGTASPGLGGFTFATATASRKVFVTKIIAKIPTGYTLKWATNGTGDGNSKWLTSQAGTGDWKEYVVKLTCGYSGTFSTTNYFYIDGNAATSSNPISWYVSYAQVRDITDINFEKARSLAISGNDIESGISAYGINQSSTTKPTFKEISNTSISEIISLEQYNSDGTYYIWLKDKAGNISEPKQITIDIGAEYVFTKSVLDSGTKLGATVSSWGGYYGLSITGRTNNAAVSGIYDHPLNTLLRWYKTIDFTKYNYLEFQVRKGAENGSSMVYIGNSWIWARYYKDLSTSWTKVKLDISNYTGNQILSFVGGYMDNTGLTTSNTQYLYMRLYK